MYNNPEKMKDTEETITSKSQKKVTKGGDEITETIRVRKVENGFVLEITEEGYKKNKKRPDSCGDWYCHTKTYISETDPLSDEPVKSLKEQINDAITNIKL